VNPDELAHTLWRAWTDGTPLTDPPRLSTADAGWAVQQRLADLAGPGYGWKIAATSAAGQAHIGVDGPLPGRLCERFRYEPGAVLPSRQLHMRVVEAEFVFRMGRAVPPGSSRSEILDAVADLHLGVEIPDSRYAGFATAGGPALLADLACAGMFVLGPRVTEWQAADLPRWTTSLTVNGVEAARGSGGAVLGDPCEALVWLVGELGRFGTALRAGEVVTTGTTTVPPAIGPGDVVHADFGAYGHVDLSFAP
jgi:2-keto-4-pentenoate hydratase